MAKAWSRMCSVANAQNQRGVAACTSYRARAEIIPVGIRPPASESGRKAWSTDLSDHTRFEELVLPHLNAAYNLARWLTRDVNDAEDVVQDACVRALKYVGSLNGGVCCHQIASASLNCSIS